MDPHEIHERLVAAGIPALVDVELPPATYARITGMLNSVLVSPVPGWIMKLYAVQDGLTACYYHCRNVERIELGVDAIARRAYRTTPSDMPETNTSFAARTLTYEYQAFLFALRRSFDYLGAGLSQGFACPPATSFKDLPRVLRQAPVEDRAAADAISAQVMPIRKAFPDVFGDQKGLSLRDQVAHRASVAGGQFTLWFRAGYPVAVELNGGGENLPLTGKPTEAPGRLCAILLDRLVRFEEVFMELVSQVPAIAAARTKSSG